MLCAMPRENRRFLPCFSRYSFHAGIRFIRSIGGIRFTRFVGGGASSGAERVWNESKNRC
jgi:hypothetical protein